MTIRPAFMVGALVAAHLLDFCTFVMALVLFQVPIAAEQNVVMARAYSVGGFGLVSATEFALVAFVVALLARVKNKPIWPLFLLFYAFGLLGTAANLAAMHDFGGI